MNKKAEKMLLAMERAAIAVAVAHLELKEAEVVFVEAKRAYEAGTVKVAFYPPKGQKKRGGGGV